MACSESACYGIRTKIVINEWDYSNICPMIKTMTGGTATGHVF